MNAAIPVAHSASPLFASGVRESCPLQSRFEQEPARQPKMSACRSQRREMNPKTENMYVAIKTIGATMTRVRYSARAVSSIVAAMRPVAFSSVALSTRNSM